MGIFPILILDTFTNNLKDLGVPGIYIQSWEDLNSFSDDKLNNLYNKLLTENYTKYSLFEFWEKSITSKLITD